MTHEEFEKVLLGILESVPVVTLATCATGTPWTTMEKCIRNGDVVQVDIFTL